MTDDQELCYLAGLFDGEGCVVIDGTPGLVLNGCFRPGLLEKFAARWGGKITVTKSKNQRHRDSVR